MYGTFVCENMSSSNFAGVFYLVQYNYIGYYCIDQDRTN